MKFLQLIFIFALFAACNSSTESDSDSNEAETVAVSDYVKEPVYLDKINLPDGYKIDLYADGIENARSMALSPKGTLFIGTRSKGSVYALVDTDGDMKGDKQYVLDTGLNMPNGVAFKDGDLYVAEVNRIL